MNLDDLKKKLSQTKATGSTNISAAIDCCASLFDTDSVLTGNEYDNRIVFLTDAQPKEGNLVYGSLEWDETKQNELLQINTLFPSRTDGDNGIQGGIVLFKLKTNKLTIEKVNTTAHLSVTHEDRLGKIFEEKQLIYIHVNNEIYSGIRKGILLVNYVTLLKKWMNHERERKYNQ